MRIKSKWLRNIASIVFSLYYLIAAEQADEKARKVRAALTVEHMRVSWNKSQTPYLSFFTSLTRPNFTRYSPKKIRIPRPPDSAYKEPISAWLYFDGPFSTIDRHNKVILDIPGGGFVAMNPRTNDDKLLAWSGKTGLPVLSLDYQKAPEYPYPYALNECYDTYHTLVKSRGRCIGLSGERPIQVIVAGDSAGGNLATGLVLMVLQASKMNSSRMVDQEVLPIPDGLILLYPALDMNINSWMTDEQMSLIQDQRMKADNRRVLRKKSQDYCRLDPSTPQPSDGEEESYFPPVRSKSSFSSAMETAEKETPSKKQSDVPNGTSVSQRQASVVLSKPKILKTRLAMSSMISYFNDRILTPEMMRAMVILYIGPHARPDFTTDYLLSPLLAPEMLLAEFPKTYLMTGERDPLVDDTVIFAGRLRQAKHTVYVQRKELGLLAPKEQFDEREHVEVMLIPGISHGFVQFVSAFPEGWKYILRCAKWMEEIFALDIPPSPEERRPPMSRADTANLDVPKSRHHSRTLTDSSAEEERPLEMTPLNGSRTATSKKNSATSKRPRAKTDVSPARKKNKKRGSVSATGSEEDLLKRRMKGLAASLMGGEIEEEPTTP